MNACTLSSTGASQRSSQANAPISVVWLACGWSLSVTGTPAACSLPASCRVLRCGLTSSSCLLYPLVQVVAVEIWPALAMWRWPSAQAWTWVLLIAFCGAYSQYCLTRAIHVAEATVVSPMALLRVPLTAVAGWLVFSEGIDLMKVIGTTLILSGNLLNLRPGPANNQSC